MTLDSRGFVLYSADIQERGTIAGADHQIKTNSGSVYEIADYASNNALVIKDNLYFEGKQYKDGPSKITLLRLYPFLQSYSKSVIKIKDLYLGWRFAYSSTTDFT